MYTSAFFGTMRQTIDVQEGVAVRNQRLPEPRLFSESTPLAEASLFRSSGLCRHLGSSRPVRGPHKNKTYDVHEEQKDTTIMTSAAPADKDVRDTSEEIQELEQQSDTGEANNAPTANASATLHRHDQDKEDPATVAASEELKHTYISDKIENSSGTGSKSTNHGSAEDKEMGGPVKASTPDPEVSEEQEDDLRERLSSPKKKRGRDQDDEVKGAGDVKEDESGNVSDADALNGAKLEPDRKRPRDLTQASGAAEEITPVKVSLRSHAKFSWVLLH